MKTDEKKLVFIATVRTFMGVLILYLGAIILFSGIQWVFVLKDVPESFFTNKMLYFLLIATFAVWEISKSALTIGIELLEKGVPVLKRAFFVKKKVGGRS